MTKLGVWTFDVFKQYQGKFREKTANMSQAILLCYTCCASEIARIKGNAKWFTREVDDISDDLSLSGNAVCRELGVLRGAMLIERKRGSVGAKQRLMFRADDNAMKRFDFIGEAVRKSKDLDGFANDLVPIDTLLTEVKDCFGVR